MHEISEDVWQMTVESRLEWSQNYFFVKRPFGNTLVYSSQKYDYAEKFLKSFGGVARQVLFSLQELGPTHQRLFSKFGAAVNVCFSDDCDEAPFDEKVRIEALAQNDYSDPQLVGFALDKDSPHRSLYLLKHKGRTIFFSGDVVVVADGLLKLHPSVDELATSEQRQKIKSILAQLRDIHIDVVAPKSYKGVFNHIVSLPTLTVQAEISRLHDSLKG